MRRECKERPHDVRRRRAWAVATLAAAAALLGSTPTTLLADTATWDDVPGSAESARLWQDITGDADLPDVQMRGAFSRPTLALVATHLAHVPLETTRRADAAPARSWLFSGRLTDLPGFTHLRGTTPTGWPAGYTWDAVSGAGAGAPGGGMVVNPDAEIKRTGEGAYALSLHEYGHVLDRIYAEAPLTLRSDAADWRSGPVAELARVGAKGWLATNPSYFLQSPAEWWAEALDLYLVDEKQHRFLATTYPQTWDYLHRLIGSPRFELQFVETARPRVLAPPVVSGRAAVGRSVRCRAARFAGATTTSTRWLRSGVTIAGARSAQYRVTRRDRGRLLACSTRATNAAGSAAAVSAGVRAAR